MGMVDITAKLLETVSQLELTLVDERTKWKSFDIRAFLWTTWQRCQMIYFRLSAISAETEGSSDGKKGELALRGIMPLSNVTLHDMSRQQSGTGKSPYMCGWNFELLRSNPVCIGADFRRFHKRFESAFSSHSARCIAGKSSACKGDSPRSCQRFDGMVIEDQSQHDQNCTGNCKQLVWDESSYRAVLGARAACLTDSASQSIRYCDATDQTLAISYVWSQ